MVGRPSMEAFCGHPREPLCGHLCLLVVCQWLICGLFVVYRYWTNGGLLVVYLGLMAETF